MGRQAALLGHLHRREPDFLPAALPGRRGDAAALHRLSRCLRRLEPGVVLRLLHLDRRHRLLLVMMVYALLAGRKAEANPWGEGATTSSEEHTYELQSLMRNSYAVLCLKKKQKRNNE